MTHKTLGEMTAPDKIWAGSVICGETPSPTRQTEYTRSDLIAHSPEVMAMVEAGKLVLHWYEWGEGLDDLSLRKAVDKMRAALAPFTGKES